MDDVWMHWKSTACTVHGHASINAHFNHHRAPRSQSGFTLQSASLLPDPHVSYVCVPEYLPAPWWNCTLVMHPSIKWILSPCPCSMHVQACAEICNTHAWKQAKCNGWCVDALKVNCVHSAWSCINKCTLRPPPCAMLTKCFHTSVSELASRPACFISLRARMSTCTLVHWLHTECQLHSYIKAMLRFAY